MFWEFSHRHLLTGDRYIRRDVVNSLRILLLITRRVGMRSVTDAFK